MVEVKTEGNNTHITAAIGSRAGRALQRHFDREKYFYGLKPRIEEVFSPKILQWELFL